MHSVCYILSYYSPDYVRTRTLVRALEQIRGIRLFQARNTAKNPWRYFQTLWQLLGVRLRFNPDIYILGFRGYEFYWVVRVITAGKRLIFDHMMSPYDSLVNETRRVKRGSLLARLIFMYERTILLASDMVLTDTDAHKRYFQQLFHLNPARIAAIPVAADEDLFHPIDISSEARGLSPFEVLYYGSFLPLHGIDLILNAASALKDRPVHFTLIGGNRLDLTLFHQRIEELGIRNVSHVDWVEFEQLPKYIAGSHLGLGGPFGNTGQGRRVITGKTFQFMAMAKAAVVGAIDQDCGFIDKFNCLIIPQGNEQALVDAISWALEHRDALEEIGRQGRQLYLDCYSIEHVSEMLKEFIHP